MFCTEFKCSLLIWDSDDEDGDGFIWKVLFFVTVQNVDPHLLKLFLELMKSVQAFNPKAKLTLSQQEQVYDAGHANIISEQNFEIEGLEFILRDTHFEHHLMKFIAPIQANEEYLLPCLLNNLNLILYFLQACTQQQIWESWEDNCYISRILDIGKERKTKICFLVNRKKSVQYVYKYKEERWSHPIQLKHSVCLSQIVHTSKNKPEINLANLCAYKIYFKFSSATIAEIEEVYKPILDQYKAMKAVTHLLFKFCSLSPHKEYIWPKNILVRDYIYS